MTTSKRIYIRPDEDLSREEGIRQVVNAFLEFIIEQAEARGDHKSAARLRAELAADSATDQEASAKNEPGNKP